MRCFDFILWQEISKDFDRNYNDLVGSFKEQLQAQYPIYTAG